MEIYFKTLLEGNFNTNIPSSKRVNSTFEEYLKIALAEIKEEKVSKENYWEKLGEILQKIEIGFQVLEASTIEGLSFSSSETLGDFLLSQALEIDKLLDNLPEEGSKNLFKELAFFIGIEAQKIKQGYYS
ncbi:MAG: hypothetical protein NZ530_04660 [Thermodesulfobacteriaceae bacterium]|nr:hypothetical protein [Thermodesulfobacteriaceae bacterium]MCX8042143.1 hypothetical protein [Thermodesulfobacteriaceae bacterium]MDW8136322.1 hypothetical protein [Thermodesulfobacterium sp.]